MSDSEKLIIPDNQEAQGDFDKIGIRMLETDSYDVIIHALRTAAEGAANLVVLREDDAWKTVVLVLDRLRIAIVKSSGFNRPSDLKETRPVEGASVMPRVLAYERLYEGLKNAERGSRQMATCHRGDICWSMYAQQFEKMRDSCSVMARRKSGIIQVRH